MMACEKILFATNLNEVTLFTTQRNLYVHFEVHCKMLIVDCDVHNNSRSFTAAHKRFRLPYCL